MPVRRSQVAKVDERRDESDPFYIGKGGDRAEISHRVLRRMSLNRHEAEPLSLLPAKMGKPKNAGKQQWRKRQNWRTASTPAWSEAK